MASSVTEGHIQKLRSAGYLSNNIAHRLPDEGELIPTPRPHQRVVLSRPICDPIQKELEGPTKDRPAY